MGKLFETIRGLVAAGKHCRRQSMLRNRLEERGILEWQAVMSLDDGDLIVERPASESRARLPFTIERPRALPDRDSRISKHVRDLTGRFATSWRCKTGTVHFPCDDGISHANDREDASVAFDEVLQPVNKQSLLESRLNMVAQSAGTSETVRGQTWSRSTCCEAARPCPLDERPDRLSSLFGPREPSR